MAVPKCIIDMMETRTIEPLRLKLCKNLRTTRRGKNLLVRGLLFKMNAALLKLRTIKQRTGLGSRPTTYLPTFGNGKIRTLPSLL